MADLNKVKLSFTMGDRKASLTAEELVAVQELCDSASSGPWLLSLKFGCVETGILGKDGIVYGGTRWKPDFDEDTVDNPEMRIKEITTNGALMANARWLIPRLLRELLEARQEFAAALREADRSLKLSEQLAKELLETKANPISTKANPAPTEYGPYKPQAWPSVIRIVEHSGNPAWKTMLDDMQARHELGINRYGVPLQPHNGRNTKLDMYEELLDACAYQELDLLETAPPNGRHRLTTLLDMASQLKAEMLALAW